MKIFSVPDNLEGLIFDIDQTLYRHDHYYGLQENLQVREFAEEENITYEQASEKIKKYREDYARENRNNGEKPSLGNTFSHFGYPVNVTAEWRKKLFKPEKYLSYDKKLVKAFKKLAAELMIIAVTNNADIIGIKTLEVLGIADFFKAVLGLDSTGVSKPHDRPFLDAARKLNLACSSIAAVGDRYNIDLEIPISLGMGGVLVENMDDVYRLPEVLLK